MNPADSLTKLYKDPISAINSMIYRFGPQSYGSRAALEQDVVATCENGVFTYLGLPAKFLTEDKSEKERCNSCQEEPEYCALVMTRARAKAEQKEDLSSSDDSQSDSADDSQKRLLRAWAKRVKGILHIGSGDNLLDHQYDMKLSLTLEKEVYKKWTSKFFSMERLIRAAACLVCLHTKGMDTSNIDNRKEAWGLILRSAQRHFSEGVGEISDLQEHGIRVMGLRLQSNTARSLYGTKYLPVIGVNDPMRIQLL